MSEGYEVPTELPGSTGLTKIYLEKLLCLCINLHKLEYNTTKSDECLRQYMVITHSKGKDQSGKAANLVRGQLNRENEYIFPRLRSRLRI